MNYYHSGHFIYREPKLGTLISICFKQPNISSGFFSNVYKTEIIGFGPYRTKYTAQNSKGTSDNFP